MEITSAGRAVEATPLAQVSAAPEQAAENREVIQAVKAVNAAEVLGQENELEFQMDRNAQRMVVKLVNRETKDVVSQIPPEYVLRMAEQLKNATS